MERKINLFVYGTLMQGFRANSFIPKEAVMEKGKLVGNLYHFIAGYPIVQIPKEGGLVDGSLDYDRDLDKQDSYNRIPPACLPYNNEYGCVHGELYQIPYSESVMEKLDGYEGFNGNTKTGLYCRTLVPVKTEGNKIIYAWVYNMNVLPDYVIRVYSGDWRDCFRPYGGGIREEVYDALIKIKEKYEDVYSCLEEDDLEDDLDID